MTAGGPHQYRFLLERDSRWKRTYALHGGGSLFGWLQLGGGFGRSATADVGSDRWLLTSNGFFRRRIDMTSEATGQLLAQVRGRELVILGGPQLWWQRMTLFDGAHALVRADNVVAAHFSRLRGWGNRSMEIDVMNGHQHFDLVCAFVGSWMKILEAQAAAASGGAAAGSC